MSERPPADPSKRSFLDTLPQDIKEKMAQELGFSEGLTLNNISNVYERIIRDAGMRERAIIFPIASLSKEDQERYRYYRERPWLVPPSTRDVEMIEAARAAQKRPTEERTARILANQVAAQLERKQLGDTARRTSSVKNAIVKKRRRRK
jgi:hypothetical protein